MSKKLILAMAAAMSIAAFGCGDDEEATTGGGGASGGANTPENVAQAVEACKQSVDAQPALSAKSKEELKAVCDKGSSGDEQDIKDATREVCTRIIEETVPAGAARDQAIETCKTATE